MPTGYTAVLLDKPETTFESWALLCARAFGALILMRDDAMDAPIPEEFNPSTYAAEQEKIAEAKYQDLSLMDESAREAYGAQEKLKAIALVKRCLAEYISENTTLDAMAEKVTEWQPPTDEHQGLKQFMLEQIQISRHDLSYSEKDLARLQGKQPIDFYNADLKSTLSSIAYYAKSQAEENDRTAKRNQWVKDLRESLTGNQTSRIGASSGRSG